MEIKKSKCQRCHHECVASVTGKTSDMFGIRWPGGKEQIGYVLPHRLIGLREGDASNDYMNFSYCLVCGQIQGKWPVGGAKRYLEQYAPIRYHEVYLMCDDGSWSTIYFTARNVEKVKEALKSEEFKHVVRHLIVTTDDGWNWDELEVREL